MTKLKQQANALAKHGRNGDDHLVHVSGAELQGLASLGKLTKNPKTGLPEAFNLAWLLAPAAALAAPFALPALAGAGAAGLAGAATAGAGAAGAAGAGAAGLGGLAAAAPTAATAATSGLAGLGAAAPGLTGAAAGSGVGSALAATAPTAATAAGTQVASLAPGIGLGSAAPATGGLVAPTTAATVAPAHAAMTVGANMAGDAMPLPGLQAANGVSAATGSVANMANPGGLTAAGLTGSFPAAPGIATGATQAAGGTGLKGLLGGMDIGKLAQYGALGSMILPSLMGSKKSKDDDDSGSGGDPKSYDRGQQADNPSGGSDGGVNKEFNYYPEAHYYAKGGLASLDDDKNSDDTDLIDKTIQAITSQDPDGQKYVHKFLKEFGPQALQDLVGKIQAKTQGGQQTAPQDPNSDGLSDSVPAVIQGAQGQQAPAQISEGEYVVPSDVVAHLGNGSTGAGAKQLEGMVARTRAARGSPSAGPTQIDPQAMMPQ
jgi:hypothetical protein